MPRLDHSFWRGGYEGSVETRMLVPHSTLIFTGMLTCASVEEFLDFTLKIVECSMLLMKKTETLVTQHVFIFDLKGFSLKVLLRICYL